jgi:hypothetical protein
MFESRISRERHTVDAMIRIYCCDLHGGKAGLCPKCRELAEYAGQKLDECPFQENKTNCDRCPVHCYNVEMRKRIKEVMRYAGPRMMRRHPILAILHIIDGLTKQ